jgi:hypothetical protein
MVALIHVYFSVKKLMICRMLRSFTQNSARKFVGVPYDETAPTTPAECFKLLCATSHAKVLEENFRQHSNIYDLRCCDIYLRNWHKSLTKESYFIEGSNDEYKKLVALIQNMIPQYPKERLLNDLLLLCLSFIETAATIPSNVYSHLYDVLI